VKCLRVVLAAVMSCWLVQSVGAAEIDTSAEYAFVTDFGSGKVLMERNPDALMKPASMAKIMTVYIAFQRIADGSLSLDDTFLISTKAWRKGGSKTFIEVGKQVAVRDLLYGIVVQSGNDAAIAVAEGISGTEDGFAEEMNYVAKRLGMENTTFRNSTGWPDPEQFTTARDLNILATAMIRDFPLDTYPELYSMFAEKEFTYNGIKQGNRNPLVYGTEGADGLKTGHTEESGYGLVGSAHRDGQRVVMVLNGLSSMKQRSSESRRLMDLMFREFKLYRFFDKGESVDQANVWLGRAPKVDLVLNEPLHLVLSRTDRRRMKMSLQWSDPVPAPVTAGQTVGTLVLQLPDEKLVYPLTAASDVAELGLFDRVGEAFKYLIFGAGADSIQFQ
jgi:D-alanyl-D-alanine carboxypeptidase (penicillin-binding protein 5/6)